MSFYISVAGAVFGLLTVALGAFGAHALKDVLTVYGHEIWQKAVFYQAFHSVVLLMLPFFSSHISKRSLNMVGSLFISGILLFSGSLYLLALTEIRILGAITPFGGVSFAVAWAWLAILLWKTSQT